MLAETSLRELRAHLRLPQAARCHLASLATPEGSGDVWRVVVASQDLVARRMPIDRVRRHFLIMKELHATLLASGVRHLDVPEPLFASEESGLFVERYVRGARVTDLVSAGASETVAAEIGHALATLHGLPLEPGRPRGLMDHVRDLVSPHPAILADELPAHRALILEALDVLSRADAGWGSLPLAPLHRDFHLRQLLHRDDRICVVDWDRFAWGDPAFDVGYFTTYLANHLDRPTAERWSDAFLSTYDTRRGGHMEARRPVYELFNHLRRACRRFRRRDRDWCNRMRRSLAAVEETLARVR